MVKGKKYDSITESYSKVEIEEISKIIDLTYIWNQGNPEDEQKDM